MIKHGWLWGTPFSDKPRLFVSSCLHASVWYTQLLLFPEKFVPTDNFGLVQPITPDLYFLVYDIASQTIASSKRFIWASVSASSLGTGVTRFGKHRFKGTEQFQPCSVVWHHHLYRRILQKQHWPTSPMVYPMIITKLGHQMRPVLVKNHPMSFLTLNYIISICCWWIHWHPSFLLLWIRINGFCFVARLQAFVFFLIPFRSYFCLEHQPHLCRLLIPPSLCCC